MVFWRCTSPQGVLACLIFSVRGRPAWTDGAGVFRISGVLEGAACEGTALQGSAFPVPGLGGHARG
jgi:hypothetical protein